MSIKEYSHHGDTEITEKITFDLHHRDTEYTEKDLRLVFSLPILTTG